MNHPRLFLCDSCRTARSSAAHLMSGVVIGEKRAVPAFRQSPHHSSGEAPKALRRALPALEKSGMTHSRRREQTIVAGIKQTLSN